MWWEMITCDEKQQSVKTSDHSTQNRLRSSHVQDVYERVLMWADEFWLSSYIHYIFP